MSSKENTQNKPKQDEEIDSTIEKHLILHNDDYHSFDYVIEAFVITSYSIHYTKLYEWPCATSCKPTSDWPFSYLATNRQHLFSASST